jgi:hypothetical protein
MTSPDTQDGKKYQAHDHTSKEEAAHMGVAMMSVRSHLVGFSPKVKTMSMQDVYEATWRYVTGLYHHHRKQLIIEEGECWHPPPQHPKADCWWDEPLRRTQGPKKVTKTTKSMPEKGHLSAMTLDPPPYTSTQTGPSRAGHRHSA